MTDERIHPVILSGGAGTRLWPLSRALHPKQFLSLTGESTPFAQTLLRVSDQSRFAPPLVVCNEEQRYLVGEALRRCDIAAEAIVVEPMARNTGPAACIASLMLAARNPRSLMLLLPSDHHVADEAGFLSAVDLAAEAAASKWLATFGITPSRPDTGYGYIRCAEPLEGLAGCRRVGRFVEKPARATAEAYLASGEYVWNSGMFLFAAETFLGEANHYCPEIVTACRDALDGAAQDHTFLPLNAEAFARAPSISIDHAVFEKTERAVVVPAEIGWTDLGTWDALWQVCETDSAGNVVVGDVVTFDTQDSYLRSNGQVLATVGVCGMVVVALRDAIVVCPKDRAQDIRQVVDQLEAAGRDEHRAHPRVRCPWGSYESVGSHQGFQVRHLILRPGASISLRHCSQGASHWVVVRGRAEVTCDGEVFVLEVDESTQIPRDAANRLRNAGEDELHIVEVRSGRYPREIDVSPDRDGSA